MSKRKPPKKEAVKESLKSDSKKTKQKKSLERSLQLTEAHLLAAVEQYLHSMRLIEASEKILSTDYPTDKCDWYYFKIVKEVSTN